MTSEPVILDLDWLGRPGLIGAWRVGDLLIDCGPQTAFPNLLHALGDWQPKAVLLTHIHFDHAGAAGELVALWPDLEVWVHRLGAGHLASPERLENSARRVFGDDFDRRFGPMRAVPVANIHALDGGESVYGMAAEATPGHAKHHLAYFAEDGAAFTGDVAGVRLDADGRVLLPTPPPDIDLEEWGASLDLIASRRPTRLLLPHFGAYDDPEHQIEAARGELARQRELAKRLSSDAYVAHMREEFAKQFGESRQVDYELVVPLQQNLLGLQRALESPSDR